MIVAVIAALTVTIAMRVVGLLLVSALMIVPVAIAQLFARSFGRTMTLASVIGVVVSVVGLVLTYWQDIPPGATIVVLAILVYAVAASLRPLCLASAAAERPAPGHGRRRAAGGRRARRSRGKAYLTQRRRIGP